MVLVFLVLMLVVAVSAVAVAVVAYGRAPLPQDPPAPRREPGAHADRSSDER